MPALRSCLPSPLVLAACFAAYACMTPDRNAAGGTVRESPFGTLPSGEPVHVFTLANAHGIELRAIDYGGIVLSLRTPDRAGRFDDIVLGFDSLAGYLGSSPYFGAIVGRYANRIRRGTFTLDGVTYHLAINNPPNALHGGLKGFDKVLWHGTPFHDSSGVGVHFSYTSADGEEGYPGTLTAEVTYTLTDDDRFVIAYDATADQATPVNLTQHTYFNLAGDGARDVLDHVVTIDAGRYTPVDSTLIPTGTLAPVDGTPFDFRTPAAIGARIAEDDPQLRIAGGYDHNFVLDSTGALVHAAHVEEPSTGRTLDVYTTQPGVQFYTGNFLDGSITGKKGHVYRRRFGFCLETQHFPDSPNEPTFPSTILRPGEEYRTRTVYAFGVTR